MGDNGFVRVTPIVAVVLLGTACASSPSNGHPSSSSVHPFSSSVHSSSSSTQPSSSATQGPVAVSLRVADGVSLLVRGTYPPVHSKCKHPEHPLLKARYPGELSIRRADDGSLGLTVTLPFERYLDGIAEVPSSWPMAALEAQAIAARSYALASTGWGGARGEKLKTPICGTASCQVYAGIPVRPERGIHRWSEAVRRTAGRVLLYRGRPADAVYFSTSNGHTYGNDQIFGSAPLPYLRPVVERDDRASPESHWRVRLPFRDLATFLHAAGEWPKGKDISGVLIRGSTLVIEGPGTRQSVDESAFSSAVNTWAPCFEPRRYPPASWKGAPLPVTVPSAWFRVAPAKGAVILVGRGWGHGVGMVQWGAYGKARRGLSAPQILAYYYGGLHPQHYPEPGLIHVLVATGLTSLSIVPSGPGAKLDGRPLRARKLHVTGGDHLVVRTRD